MRAIVVLKGGPGSGNHGHRGIPGHQGGSLPKGTNNVSAVNSENLVIADTYAELGKMVGKPENGTNYFISPDDKLFASKIKSGGKSYWSQTSEHAYSFADAIKQHPELTGLTKSQITAIQLEIERHPENIANIGFYSFAIDAIHSGVIRVREGTYLDNTGARIYIQTSELNNVTLRRLQRLVDTGKLPNLSKYTDFIWDNSTGSNTLRTSGSEFMSSKYVTSIDDEIVLKQLPITEKDKQKLLDLRVDLYYKTSDDLSTKVFTGEITIGQWEEQMRAELRQLHSSATAVAKGGWDQMTSADWGRLGTPLREQYKYLHGFATTIAEQKDIISLRAIQARARMYGRATGKTAALIQAGAFIEKLLPWIPGDGQSKCFFEGDKVRVYTQENGYVRLSSVKVGEHVLTHKGHFRKVLANESRRVENVNSVELDLSLGKRVKSKLSVTPDHLFMDKQGNWIQADSITESTNLMRIGEMCNREGCENIINIPPIHYNHTPYCSYSCATIGEHKYDACHEKTRELSREGKHIFQKLHKDPVYIKRYLEISRRSIAKIHENRIGKTYEEFYGADKSTVVKKKLSVARLGKSWESMYGEERSKVMRINNSKQHVGNKYAVGHSHPGSFVEKYGKEKADRIREKLRTAAKRQWLEHYDELKALIVAGNNRKSANSYITKRRTKPERLMADMLANLNYTFKEQKWLLNGGCRVDFFLPDYSTVIEVDGEHWHNLPGRREQDAERDKRIIEQHGYQIIRFDASVVMKTPEIVRDRLVRTFANHRGEYVQTGDVKVLAVRRVMRSGMIRCLLVEEDESFVVTGGLVSHNCLVSCKCRWDLRVIKVDPKSKDKTVKAVWRLSPAEHCVDCLERNGYIITIVVPKDIEVPRYIGRGREV